MSVIVPCANEGPTVTAVIEAARAACDRLGLRAEVIVVDSGSIDGTAAIAREAGAQVVTQAIPGYGAACLRGVEMSRGAYLVFVDGDGTYDLSILHRFIEPLRAGYALVVGTRRNGAMGPGSMSWFHRHVLEPLQTHFLRQRFGFPVSDVRCGLRAIRRDTMVALGVGATGMEFASDMLISAAQAGLEAVEVPVQFIPRVHGAPRRRAADSWRVLRQLLLLSPSILFLGPGLVALVLGLALELALTPGPVHLSSGLVLDYHFMFAGSALAMFGFQLVLLGLYARTYALMQSDLAVTDPWMARFHHVYTLERGVLVGTAVSALGFAIVGRLLADYLQLGAAQHGAFFGVRPAVLALTLLMLGGETIFASFFLSLLRNGEYGRA